MKSNKSHTPSENRVSRAIVALLENPSVEKAAAAINVSPVTMWRWMQQTDFQARLRLARRRAYSQCVGRLQQASSAAVGTLLRVMTDQAVPAGSRVRAADSVLDHAARAIEIEPRRGNLWVIVGSAGRLTEESEKLTAGGIKGPLLLL
jgi:hypothetical protein